MPHQIPLGNGHVALVDPTEYNHLSKHDGFLSGTGYAAGFVPINGRYSLVYMHRFIMHASPGQVADHINGANKLDNRRANLRFATPQQNSQHKRLSSLSCTGLKGVGWHKRRCKYQARIQLQGTRCHLGFFDDSQEAAIVYDAAARKLFGKFAVCNYPDKKTHWTVAQQVRRRLQQRGLKVK